MATALPQECASPAYVSDEFRAFAIKWLGFDPHEAPMNRSQRIVITLEIDAVPIYVTQNLAERQQ